MQTLRLKKGIDFREGLSHFSVTKKWLLALFLTSISFALKANDNPYFASKDYFHWADKIPGWDNGNLNKTKSSYKEGDVVAHAYVPNGLVNGTIYTVVLKYDNFLSTKNAGGFTDLVWNPAQFSKSPSGQLGEGPLTTANQTFGAISYYATNITLTGVTALPDGSSGNTDFKLWQIQFMYTGTTGSDAALYFGLQLAVKDQVKTPSNGAAAWAGASLQTYLDPASDPGTRSLQIDPGAIQSACPTPPTVSAGSYGPLCSNSSPILLGGTPGGGTWTGTGVSGDATNGYYFDPSAGTQTLIYTFTDANACSNSDETTITVNTAPTVTAGSYGPLCSNGSAVTLGGSPAGGVWTGTGVSGSQANGYKFDPSAGTQTLTYSYTDANGCSGSAQVTITVNTAPVCSLTQTVPGSGNPKVGQVASFTAPAGYGYAWTISSVGNTANASIANNTASSQAVQVITTAAGSYSLLLTITDLATGCKSSCSKAVTVDPIGPFITYTQGFYGNSGGKACNGKNSYMIMNDAMTAANGTMRFGNSSDSRSFTLVQADVNNTTKSNIYKMLPGGTTPAVLKAANLLDDFATTASYANSKTWPAVPMNPGINNVLLAQTMALRFNLYYSNSVSKPISGLVLTGNVLTFARPTTSCGSTYQTTGISKTIPCSVFNYISGMAGGATIGNLLTLANKVLGGEVSTVSPGDMNVAVDAINTGFDGGAQIIGVSRTCTGSPVVSRGVDVVAEAKLVKAITVAAYPNPFTDRVRFTLQSPKAGRATLEVYNLLGQKLAVPFEGQLNANETKSVEYTAPVNHRSSLIYRFSVNGEQVSGKLMNSRQ